jgi:hypothetical protein
MYNECRHIFTSGKKCQSPALKDQNFCYFHSNTRRVPQVPLSNTKGNLGLQGQPSTAVHTLPPLEDADAIQLALSDVVLALAANRIDPRRARILIYGLQVASQNHRNRSLVAAKEEVPAQTVRETHEHEDGTLIGPAKQSPDPEEIEQQRRPPSLGEILLREAEALKAQAEAQKKAVEAAKSAEHTSTSQLPHTGLEIKAVAEEPPAKPCRSLAPRKPRMSNVSQRCAGQPAGHAATVPGQAPVHCSISPLESSTSPSAEVFCSPPVCLVPSQLDACARQGQSSSSSAPHLFVNRPFAKSREDCFVRTRQVSIHLRVGD